MTEHKLCWKCREYEREKPWNPSDHCHHYKLEEKPKPEIDLNRVRLYKPGGDRIHLEYAPHFTILTISRGGIIRCSGLEGTGLPVDDKGRILFKE